MNPISHACSQPSMALTATCCPALRHMYQACPSLNAAHPAVPLLGQSRWNHTLMLFRSCSSCHPNLETIKMDQHTHVFGELLSLQSPCLAVQGRPNLGGGVGLGMGRVPSGCTSASGALRTRRVQRSGNCSASVMASSSPSDSATFAASSAHPSALPARLHPPHLHPSSASRTEGQPRPSPSGKSFAGGRRSGGLGVAQEGGPALGQQ